MKQFICDTCKYLEPIYPPGAIPFLHNPIGYKCLRGKNPINGHCKFRKDENDFMAFIIDNAQFLAIHCIALALIASPLYAEVGKATLMFVTGMLILYMNCLYNWYKIK